jgi:hypothetical protein
VMTQRMIRFETSTDEGVVRTRAALSRAFEALAEQRPAGVGPTYRQVRGSRRFVALTDLPDDEANPRLQVDAAWVRPRIIGDCVPGGYPRPTVVEHVGACSSLPDRTSDPHAS